MDEVNNEIWNAHTEGKYDISIDKNMIIKEGFGDDILDTLKIIGGAFKAGPAWFGEILGYLRNVSISAAGGVILGKAVASLLSFAISKVLRKQQEADKRREDTQNVLFNAELSRLDELTPQNVDDLRMEVAEKCAEYFPKNNKAGWAIFLEKVQTILNSTFGLTGAAIGMGLLYSKLGGMPDYNEVYDKANS